MQRSQYKMGEFLYKISSDESIPENQRVFIHNGYKNGDGYGILIGWSEGKVMKSTGWGNFCWGNNVRRATEKEIESFMNGVMAQNVKNY